MAISTRPAVSNPRRLRDSVDWSSPMRSAKRAERIVGGGGDLRHQAELGEAQPAFLHAVVEEFGDAPRREPAVPAGTFVQRGAGIADEGLWRSGWTCGRLAMVVCMYIICIYKEIAACKPLRL